jgi:hypothetical protein
MHLAIQLVELVDQEKQIVLRVQFMQVEVVAEVVVQVEQLDLVVAEQVEVVVPVMQELLTLEAVVVDQEVVIVEQQVDQEELL